MKKLLLVLLFSLPLLAQAPTPLRLTNLDEASWSTCGACGNTGAVGTAPVSSAALVAFSRDGSARQFSIAPTGGWQNTYWYQKRAFDCNESNSVVEFDIYVTAADDPVLQPEFENQVQCHGYVYNGGWQGNRSSKVWRVFNKATHAWEATTVPYAFAPDTWHHVKAVYREDYANHFHYHVALIIDGVVYPVNIQHAAVYTTSITNFISNAFQLDGDKAGDKYSVVVDKYSLEAF